MGEFWRVLSRSFWESLQSPIRKGSSVRAEFQGWPCGLRCTSGSMLRSTEPSASSADCARPQYFHYSLHLSEFSIMKLEISQFVSVIWIPIKPTCQSIHIYFFQIRLLIARQEKQAGWVRSPVFTQHLCSWTAVTLQGVKCNEVLWFRKLEYLLIWRNKASGWDDTTTSL